MKHVYESDEESIEYEFGEKKVYREGEKKVKKEKKSKDTTSTKEEKVERKKSKAMVINHHIYF